jgi:hypothetical protein
MIPADSLVAFLDGPRPEPSIVEYTLDDRAVYEQ